MSTGPAVDYFDGPEIAQTIAQLVTFAGIVVTGLLAGKANINARAARSQVENDHGDAENPNLRVNLDANESKAERRDGRLNAKVDTINSLVLTLVHDVAQLKAAGAVDRDDIDTLMDTEQRRRDYDEWGPENPTTRRDRRRRP